MGMAIFMMPGTGASAQDAQRVRMFDDCDVASFNAAIGPGTCVGDGRTTFGDFVAQLQENGDIPNRAAKGWAFKPGNFHIDADEHINAVNKGGETHTFTEVAQFGGGCVQVLNDLLGGGLVPVPECAEVDANDVPLIVATAAAPGGTVPVSNLSPGLHKFQCLIHPWMQAQVEVRADDHGGHHHG
jgi:hypothetical protein